MPLISTVSSLAVKSFGVFHVYKTRRFVVVFERFFAFWGDMQLCCTVYDRAMYESSSKVPIYRMLKGSYCVSEFGEQGVAKPIELLKHVHQRMKLGCSR